MKHFSLIN